MYLLYYHTTMNNTISISVPIHSDINTVWDAFNAPEHIKKWYKVSDAWCCPQSQSMFREGGRFTHTMSSLDGGMQFNFEWIYTAIKVNELVSYMLDDDRRVEVTFVDEGTLINVTLEFEPEMRNDTAPQQQLWEAVLSSFASYAEGL